MAMNGPVVKIAELTLGKRLGGPLQGYLGLELV
jgi:hypothetical protein